MFDHVSLPAKLPFEKEDVGDLPKSSSSQKNENGELLVLSIGAIKQPRGLLVLDQHAQLDYFHNASSLKQQSVSRHVAPLGHIIVIPSQPVFAFSP
jgi:hypothetical protein